MSEPEVELENEDQPDTFSRDYVETLRAEAAENRVKAKEAEDNVSTFRDAYRAAVLKDACAGVLTEPLEWSDDYETDGMPDAEKIRAAADAVALEKPHLSRVAGGIPQGPQGDESDTAVDLAGMLRAGA